MGLGARRDGSARGDVVEARHDPDGCGWAKLPDVDDAHELRLSGTGGRRGERQRIPFMQAPKWVFCRVPGVALARGDENALRA